MFLGVPAIDILLLATGALVFFGLLIIDEIGYTPIDRKEANLLFNLVSELYEKNQSSSPPTKVLRAGRR